MRRMKLTEGTKITLEIPGDIVEIVGNNPLDIELRIHNDSDITDDFYLTFGGVPPGWVIISLPAISRVTPGRGERVTLRVFPPTMPEALREPFTIMLQVHQGSPSVLILETPIQLAHVTG